MNTTDFDRYYLPAARAILGETVVRDMLNLATYEPFEYFDKLIGVDLVGPFRHRPINLDTPLSNEHRELLQKLAGPNGKFYLAVRKARLSKDDRHEDTPQRSR